MDSMKSYESPTHDRYVGIVRSFWEDFPNQHFKFFVAQGLSKSSKWVDPRYMNMNMKIQPSIVIKVAIIYVIQHWNPTKKASKIAVETTKYHTQIQKTKTMNMTQQKHSNKIDLTIFF